MRRYLRFPNGGAKLYDDSECCPFSIATKRSIIHRHSSVWSSQIADSRISGSTITNAKIKNSFIRQTLVAGGEIENSIIRCEIVTGNAEVKNCKVLGASRIAHQAQLKNVKIKNLTVQGEAILEDWFNEEVFDGCYGYLSRGIWQRPPQILRLSGLTITESIPGFAYCGCYEYEISHWLKIGEKYGEVYGLTPFEVDQIRQFLLKLHN